MKTERFNVHETRDLLRKALKLPEDVKIEFNVERIVNKSDSRSMYYELTEVAVKLPTGVTL